MNTAIPTNTIWSAVLGASNGLFFSGALILSLRYYFDNLLRRGIEDAERIGMSPPNLLYMINEQGIALVLTTVFMGAGCLVHYFWPRHWKSSILFWQAVGITAITGWNLAALGVSGWAGHPTSPYELPFGPNKAMFGPAPFFGVIVVNFVFCVTLNFVFKTLSFVADRLFRLLQTERVARTASLTTRPAEPTSPATRRSRT